VINIQDSTNRVRSQLNKQRCHPWAIAQSNWTAVLQAAIPSSHQLACYFGQHVLWAHKSRQGTPTCYVSSTVLQVLQQVLRLSDMLQHHRGWYVACRPSNSSTNVFIAQKQPQQLPKTACTGVVDQLSAATA
jgi:hypothetical protein